MNAAELESGGGAVDDAGAAAAGGDPLAPAKFSVIKDVETLRAWREAGVVRGSGEGIRSVVALPLALDCAWAAVTGAGVTEARAAM